MVVVAGARRVGVLAKVPGLPSTSRRSGPACLVALVTVLLLTSAAPAQAQQPHYDWEWLQRQGPMFTPFQIPPDILNREHLEKAKVQIDGYVEGDACTTTEVWLLIDREGVTRETRIKESARDREMDRLALAYATIYRFSPALRDGDPVPAWIAMPITIGADDCPPGPEGGPKPHPAHR